MNSTQKRRPRNYNSSSPSNRSQSNSRPSRAKASNISTINPDLFVKRAILPEDNTYIATRKISELPVQENIKVNLLSKGYTHPTEIQDKTIEAILEGKDVLGIAQTGTGKTGAFLIPLVHRLLTAKAHFRILIVVPTRELAVQVEQEFKSISKGMRLDSACFIGGTNLQRDLALLKRSSPHLVIGTPGRLLDLERQRVLKINQFSTLVLDEFDRLLDMGFYKDIQHIVDTMTNRNHTVLFSATEEKSQRALISGLLNNPVEVRVSKGNVTGDHIDQEIVKVAEGENKISVLMNMIKQTAFQKVMVFAETKRGVNSLYKKLHQAGVRVDQIHGNKSQNYRLKALNDFKSGRIQVLIATDVAARGLDITEVTHVINYQQPKNFDSYIHRIGRTGRAGKGGKAYTFIN